MGWAKLLKAMTHAGFELEKKCRFAKKFVRYRNILKGFPYLSQPYFTQISGIFFKEKKTLHTINSGSHMNTSLKNLDSQK